ncbi:MAG: GNAT family N-acetyltransferase, partial [Anaerolineae bacterium]|nr:GNAT family N-acetyltransferase [Anaerolineae bacterium]
MSAAGLISAQNTFTGLRPIKPRRDLAAIADLIEFAFADTLDAGGRSVIREMRFLSRSGPLLWLIARLNNAIPLMRGFVWIEQGELVGNVSLAPTTYDRGWIIANVAVYPAYRRRGIARQMMQAALAWVQQHGTFATLQVDADNAGARTLYDSLGFVAERTFTRWRRSSHLRTIPAPILSGITNPPDIRRLDSGQAQQLYTLATQTRPNERGGMGWLRSTRRAALRPSRSGRLGLMMSGQRTEFWGIPRPDDPDQIDAALCVQRRIDGLTT